MVSEELWKNLERRELFIFINLVCKSKSMNGKPMLAYDSISFFSSQSRADLGITLLKMWEEI